MFVDLHTHILPLIDDGAEDADTSLEMLRIAAEDGIGHMIATPHFIAGEYDNAAAVVHKKCAELTGLCMEAGININIYPGSEVFISPEVPEQVAQGLICTLNNSSYVLVELPMMSVPEYTSELFYQLRLKGYTPIIAHPERNRVIGGNPNALYDFIHAGALSQVNATSLTGLYGSRIKEIAVSLLRHNMAHFIASDAHTCKRRSPRLGKAAGIAAGELGREAADRLLLHNGLSVIHDEAIETEEPERISSRRSFFIPLFKKLFTK